MAWAPSSRFEDDLVDMQPDFNLIHGQLAYELRRKQEFCPRPKSTYEFLSAREKRNAEQKILEGGGSSGRAREIQHSLLMMEKIQRIAGTRPLGEHATMADWEDTSTVELEAVSMMRHFGMMSMAEFSLPPPPKEETLSSSQTERQPSLQIMRNGRKTFPFITDPDYFRPRKTRRSKDSNTQSDTSTDTIASYKTAMSSDNSISLYGSAQYQFKSSREVSEKSQEKYHYEEVPYQLLEESITKEVLVKPKHSKDKKK
ncbi:hypothetical protein KR009_009049, partial [Drosophila setifemur]